MLSLWEVWPHGLKLLGEEREGSTNAAGVGKRKSEDSELSISLQ